MSAIVRARLLSSMLKRNNNRCFSTTVNAPKEQIVSSSSTVANEHVADQVPPPHSPPGKTGFATRLLKYGLIASVTGVLATTGYATYGTSASLWRILRYYLVFLYYDTFPYTYPYAFVFVMLCWFTCLNELLSFMTQKKYYSEKSKTRIISP